MSKLYICGYKVNISISYRSGLKLKDVNIIHQWQKISKLDTNGLKVKDDNIIHKWLKMSTLCTSGLKVGSMKGQQVSTGY